MKAISLTQPWASLVAVGAKSIETRSWQHAYRGPIAIHAAQKMPPEAVDFTWSPEVQRYLAREFDVPSGNVELPRGAIIAVARLAEVFRFGGSTQHAIEKRSSSGGLPPHEWLFGDFSPGRYGFLLRDVVRLAAPIPCRGMLGLWDVPADVLVQLPRQAA